MCIEEMTLHGFDQIAFFFDVRKECDDEAVVWQNIAFLIPFAVYAEAIAVFLYKVTITALPVHLLNRGGFFYVFLGQYAASVMDAIVI